MFDKRLRPGLEKGLVPAGKAFGKVGVSADGLTALGIAVSAVCAVAIGRGALGVAAVLLVASAVLDVLDGAVAKASGTASARGAFFDSVSDRVSDSLVLGGMAWYLIGVDSPYVALLPMAVMSGSNLISYERAKAESLGLEARGGLMERAERMLGVFLGLVFSSLMVPILWLMLALICFTSVQRFTMVWRQAGSKPVPSRANRPPRARSERPRAAGRVRWMATSGGGSGHRDRGVRSRRSRP